MNKGKNKIYLAFWIAITDREGANYAVKMSGLPIFILGVNFIIAGLMTASARLGSMTILFIVVGGLLVICSLRIRKGKAALVPFVSFVFLAATVVSLWFVPLYHMVISIMAIGLSVRGIRGWLWIRRNPRPA